MAAKEVNSFFKSHKPLFKTLLTDEQFFKKENRLLKESVIICYTLLIYFATEAIISISIFPPAGKSLTAKADRAGNGSSKYVP